MPLFYAMDAPRTPDPTRPAIVFLHAALADSRMWAPQWAEFAADQLVVRIDLVGFGESAPRSEPFAQATEVLAVMDQLGINRAVIVGASMGGRVALDLTIAHPDRVAALMLLCAPLPGHEWSKPVQAMWAREEAAMEAGDLDLAVRENLAFWLDGPERDAARVHPDVRRAVAIMQETSLRHELSHPDAAHEVPLVADLRDRLGEITQPTTVVDGAADVSDFAAIADKLAADIPNATRHTINDAAHLPSLESPEEANALLHELLTRLN